jgi:hypothetical protein
MNNNSHNTVGAVKNKKRKFNFIDFLIVLVIIAIVGIVIYVFSPWAQIEKLWSDDEVELTYFVEIKDVDIQYIDSIEEGNEIINSVTKSSLGTIREIAKMEKAYIYDYVLDEKGNMTCVLLEQPTKYNITIKVVAQADFKENIGYTVNGARVAIGEILDMRLPKYTCSGKCTQMYE